MAAEVTRYMLGASGDRFLDCTAGGGGHIDKLLRSVDRPIKIFGIDLDPDAIERCSERFRANENVKVVRGDYGRLKELAGRMGWGGFAAILADFGQSSDQLEDSSKGMSYRWDSPLDMRYDPTSSPSAAEIVNEADYRELVRIFGGLGGERRAPSIAKSVIRSRPMTTTGELKVAITRVIGQNFLNKTLSRCFMGLRVAVNRELEAIEQFLPEAMDLLAPQGRLVCLTFDSSQDVRIKNFFRSRANPCICPPKLPVCLCGRKPDLKILTPRSERPSQEEEAANPRSRSAHLRVAEKM